MMRLFDFQQQAAAQLTEAAQQWVQVYAEDGPSYIGKTPIPFVGHLKAVTGSGKTPILASTVSGIAPAVVLWTSKSSAVADQTYRNLNGKYRELLPARTQIVRERPSKSDWERLLNDREGLAIWVTTVGSWNEVASAEAGSEGARLNMHRPHPDWGGDSSPWDQLRSNSERPIWVVYDESHNQTPAQLDQLIGLKPFGFLFASATPPAGHIFDQFKEVVSGDPRLSAAAEKGRVRVSTRDVVEAQLLKSTISVDNMDSDSGSLIDAAIELRDELENASRDEGVRLRPRVLYVVEHSNARRGEVVSRPEAIWEHLRSRGVDAEDIAVYTQTRALPEEAVRVGSLNDLRSRHVHIICNRSLQEGWDDPEAYIEYFDDESNSFVRIAQVIGRALRQPGATHYLDDRLNTATLLIRTSNETFESIIDGLKSELALYSTDDVGGSPAVRLRTRNAPLIDIPVRQDLKVEYSLPQYQLGEASLEREIATTVALRNIQFDDSALTAEGSRVTADISLLGLPDVTKYRVVAASMRTRNGDYLRRKIREASRHCMHLLDPALFTGQAFEQWSCAGSAAQQLLAERASKIVDAFETTVELVPNVLQGEERWYPSAHRPSTDRYYEFENAVHRRYSQSSFNNDELEMARALDARSDGVWMRNPARGDGYGIQLPVRVSTSSSFYPDFIWWINGRSFAIDPTGLHILHEKLDGKLLTLEDPTVVLVVRGRVSQDFRDAEDQDGYTLIRPRQNRAPSPEYFTTLHDLLNYLAA